MTPSDPEVGTRRTIEGREFVFILDQFKRRFWQAIDDPTVMHPYAGIAFYPDPKPANPRAPGSSSGLFHTFDE